MTALGISAEAAGLLAQNFMASISFTRLGKRMDNNNNLHGGNA